jgi:hypothetical protein
MLSPNWPLQIYYHEWLIQTRTLTPEVKVALVSSKSSDWQRFNLTE